MKALSIRQPWASLIVHGFKPVENRTWNTHYRGQLLIHAGKAIDKPAMDWLWENEQALGLTRGWNLLPFQEGGIIGVATLTDCVTNCSSPWFFGPRGFLLRDAKPMPFQPYRGRLGLFEVDLLAAYSELALVP